MICEILRLLFNTLIADDKSFLCNSENLRQPIQMHLSIKKYIYINTYMYIFSKAMKVNFLLRMFEALCRFQKWTKKLRKCFFVVNSDYYEENTCYRHSIC